MGGISRRALAVVLPPWLCAGRSRFRGSVTWRQVNRCFQPQNVFTAVDWSRQARLLETSPNNLLLRMTLPWKVLQLHTASTLWASEADRAFAKYIILTSRGALIQRFCQKWWNCHKTKAQQGQAAHAVRLKGLLTSSMIKTGLRYVAAD